MLERPIVEVSPPPPASRCSAGQSVSCALPETFDNCSVVLDWETKGKQLMRDDATCRLYVGENGDALLAFPNVLFVSPRTDTMVLRALNALIAELKISGYVDRAFAKANQRHAVCTSETYSQLELMDLCGLFIVTGAIFAASLVVSFALRRKKLVKMTREATKMTRKAKKTIWSPSSSFKKGGERAGLGGPPTPAAPPTAVTAAASATRPVGDLEWEA